MKVDRERPFRLHKRTRADPATGRPSHTTMNITHSGDAAKKDTNTLEVKADLLVLTENQSERFWSRTIKSEDQDGCWVWTGAKFWDGYGMFRLSGARDYRGETRAHRISWLIHRGPIPEGLCVCHNCPTGDDPSCINPRHLWLGTHLQNILDREAKGRGNQVSGEAHHAKRNPGHMASGDRNGSRTHPEVRPKGEGHANAKLTNAQVIEIRRLRDASDLTKEEIGAMFGITGGMVGHIHSRRSWKHIP